MLGKKKLTESSYIIVLNFLFILSIAIDNINGYLMVQRGIKTPIGQLFRFLIIIIIISILQRKESAVRKIAFSSFFILVYSLYFTVFYDASFSREMMVLIRIFYTPFLILFFYTERRAFNIEQLYKYIVNYGFLISSLIIVCFIMGWGNLSYREAYGFGVKAFYKAGNDLSLTIVFSLAISCVYYSKYSENAFTLAKCTLITIGGILIGTRVSMLLCPTIYFLFLCIYFVFLDKKSNIVRYVYLIGAFAIVVYIGNIVYNMLDDWTMARFEMESIQSARDDLKEPAIKYISTLDGFSLFFGEGYSSLGKFISNRLGSDIEEKSAEADWVEMVGSYGYLVGGLIIFFYIYIVKKAIAKYKRERSFENLMLFFLTALFVVVSYFAGHAMNNSMISPLYGVVASIVLTKSIGEKKNENACYLKHVSV